MSIRIKLIIPFLFLSIYAFSSPLDSLRLELKNGKKYIVHRVKTKESVQTLATYYEVDELAIMEANPLITEGVKKGMIVRIPLSTERYGNVEITPVLPYFNSNTAITKSQTNNKVEPEKPAQTETVNSVKQENKVAEPVVKISNNDTQPKENVVAKKESTNAIYQTPDGVIPGKILKEYTKDGIRKIFYKVGNGETLALLAQKFNTTQSAIANANMITSGNITGGQIIKIEFDENKTQVSEVAKETPKAIESEKKGNEKTTVKEAAKETYKEAKLAVKELVKREDKELVKNEEPKAQKGKNETATETKKYGNLSVKTIGGKKYIMHTAKSANETVEILAFKYDVSIRKIKEANGLTTENLKANQVVKIPVTDEELAYLELQNTVNTEKENSSSNNIKTYDPNRYKTKLVATGVNDTTPYTWGDKIYLKDEDLTALRNKSDDESKALQLNEVHANGGGSTEEKFTHPVMNGETIESIAKKYNISTSDIANWNDLWNHRVRVGMELIVNAKRARKPYFALNSVSAEQVKTIRANDKSELIDDINEKGLCLYTDDNKFKGILHKTAPVGTLILVENADNFKRKFLTITGVLRDTSNADVIIKIDESTATELGINNPLTNIRIRYGLVQ